MDMDIWGCIEHECKSAVDMATVYGCRTLVTG